MSEPESPKVFNGRCHKCRHSPIMDIYYLTSEYEQKYSYNYENQVNNSEIKVSDNQDMSYIPNIGGDTEGLSLICCHCKAYYVKCPNCTKNGDLVLCQFISYNCMCDDCEYNEQREVEWENRLRREKDNPNGEIIFDQEYEHNFKHLNQYYYDGDMHLLYGPDGGNGHRWQCNKCGEGYSLTDK